LSGHQKKFKNFFLIPLTHSNFYSSLADLSHAVSSKRDIWQQVPVFSLLQLIKTDLGGATSRQQMYLGKLGSNLSSRFQLIRPFGIQIQTLGPV